jgi:hypothetical protein
MARGPAPMQATFTTGSGMSRDVGAAIGELAAGVVPMRMGPLSGVD